MLILRTVWQLPQWTTQQAFTSKLASMRSVSFLLENLYNLARGNRSKSLPPERSVRVLPAPALDYTWSESQSKDDTWAMPRRPTTATKCFLERRSRGGWLGHPAGCRSLSLMLFLSCRFFTFAFIFLSFYFCVCLFFLSVFLCLSVCPCLCVSPPPLLSLWSELPATVFSMTSSRGNLCILKDNIDISTKP